MSSPSSLSNLERCLVARPGDARFKCRLTPRSCTPSDVATRRFARSTNSWLVSPDRRARFGSVRHGIWKRVSRCRRRSSSNGFWRSDPKDWRARYQLALALEKLGARSARVQSHRPTGRRATRTNFRRPQLTSDRHGRNAAPYRAFIEESGRTRGPSRCYSPPDGFYLLLALRDRPGRWLDRGSTTWRKVHGSEPGSPNDFVSKAGALPTHQPDSISRDDGRIRSRLRLTGTVRRRACASSSNRSEEGLASSITTETVASTSS